MERKNEVLRVMFDVALKWNMKMLKEKEREEIQRDPAYSPTLWEEKYRIASIL